MSASPLDNLLSSDLVTDITKKVLTERLIIPVKSQPEFFTDAEFRVLVAVSDRLIPQNNTDERIDIAGMLDTALINGKGNGWRYDKLPDDRECFKSGLQEIQKEARQKYGSDFPFITVQAQDEILQHIQQGSVQWVSPEPELFFEELLVTLTELYYSHPYGRVEMNDLSAADREGWQLKI